VLIVEQRRDYKDTWLWHWFAKADDFIAGLVLLLLGATALTAFVIVKPQDHDAVLKLAGGALILFTSYSAARTLVLNRLDQRTGRIMEATQMLKEQSNAVRAGALETLAALRISLAFRSCLTSPRNHASSSRSALVRRS
jgi:hypothetical protein